MASDLSAYRVRYLAFLRALHSTRTITLVAVEALREFPANLPAKSRKSVTTYLTEFAAALTGAVKQACDTANDDSRVSRVVRPRGRLASTVLQLLMAQSLAGRGPHDLGFPYRLRAQEVVMLLAHFDAFMGDTLRAICIQEPNTLRRSKTLAWQDILHEGSWEALMRRLVDEHVYAFGWGSVKDKLAALESDCGLQVKATERHLAAVAQAEQVRHLVVHNDCRINLEYIRRTRSSRRTIGRPVQITNRFVDVTATALIAVSAETFVATAAKFFGADPTELTGICRVNADDSRQVGLR